MSFVRIGQISFGFLDLVFFGFLDFDSKLGFSSDWIGYFFRIGYIKSKPVRLHLKAREHSILS
jgi:hypothetical protein